MKISYLLVIFFISACTPQPEKVTDDTASTETFQTDPIEVAEQPAIVDDECNLVLGFDAWEPYQYADVGGRVAGLDIELITGVAEAIGCNITYQQGTWVDLLSLLKQGNIDMLLGASKTDAREQFAFFSDAYRMEEFSLYIRSGEEKRAAYKTLSEFIESGSRIGVVSDYLYGEEVAALLDDPEKSQFFKNAIMGELNIARLLDQDIDGFLEDSFVGASMLRRKALSDLIVAQGITIQTGNIYVMFSQQGITQDQLAKFNAQLQKVKQSQIYEDLLKKYSY
ncbi:substrate-binding periplasmic protein [Brumicola nitratireducens]|uniref:Amino acid ABC transporter periplasmic protein n=1 Tax=Glaciecola nitratireducens (strain JCM 12485 / KCTC 12276 / FR1064) TaxID=1085623 RepID=G4QEC6_GLANF|nr:transporter substrate-binding domain-containing protein [Glaciecola nitratireducens]AEP31400.1 amino acid ABC transporter periplasmic protein [Glaciecola nitratireducens FR1064]